MRKSTNKNNKFVKMITISVKALSKARDFYVNSMNSYADRGCYVGYGGAALSISVIEPLPRNFSNTNSLRSSIHGARSDDLDDLIRAASSRVHAKSPVLIDHRRSSVTVPRSGTVGMNKIDEEIGY